MKGMELMEIPLIDQFAWRITKWLWDPPDMLAIAVPEYLEAVPVGKPVKHKTWHRGRKSRGSKVEAPKHIDEFYHRGAYERHEIHARHEPKAAMAFRGKGFKTERGRRARKK